MHVYNDTSVFEDDLERGAGSTQYHFNGFAANAVAIDYINTRLENTYQNHHSVLNKACTNELKGAAEDLGMLASNVMPLQLYCCMQIMPDEQRIAHRCQHLLAAQSDMA